MAPDPLPSRRSSDHSIAQSVFFFLTRGAAALPPSLALSDLPKHLIRQPSLLREGSAGDFDRRD